MFSLFFGLGCTPVSAIKEIEQGPLAFPGAEGFGRYATGGRGGDGLCDLAPARDGACGARAVAPFGRNRARGADGLETGFRGSLATEVLEGAGWTNVAEGSRDIGRVWRVAEALESGIVGVNEGVISTETAPYPPLSGA